MRIIDSESDPADFAFSVPGSKLAESPGPLVRRWAEYREKQPGWARNGSAPYSYRQIATIQPSEIHMAFAVPSSTNPTSA